LPHGFTSSQGKNGPPESPKHVRRDARVKPLYDFTCGLARLEPPPPPLQALLAALHGDRESTNQFFSAITGARPLQEFMNPENIGRIVSGAASL
jgi:hypothetical protein